MKRTLLKTIFICMTILMPKLTIATIFNNVAPITINDNAPANPYPSSIAVSGMVGSVSSVTVKINNLTHSWVHDMSIILQAPSGESLLLQSGTADNEAASNLTYTISDAGLTQFSSVALWSNNGTYKPTSYFWDMWAAPAPPTPPGIGTYNAPGPFGPQTATFASTFNGIDPNGTWKLFVADFASGDAGIISGGWTLDISAGFPVGLDLKSFFGSRIDQNNRIVWETQNELNFSHFEIEHSVDNKLFEKIAVVNAIPNKTMNQQYGYVDENVTTIDNYYRLKLVDQDWLYNYSKTVYIRNDIQRNGIAISPTIVQNEFSVHSEFDRIGTITIHDFLGRNIFTVSPNTYSYTFFRGASAIMPGLYIVHVYSEGIKVKSEYLYFQ